MRKHHCSPTGYLTQAHLLATMVTLFIGLAGGLPVLAVEQSGTADPTLEHPLKPADTSSPRATLYGFLNEGNASWRRAIREGVRRGGASESRIRQQNRVFQYMDLSGAIPSERDEFALEKGILLLDVINRIALPPPAEVPDAEEMEADEETKWVIPQTSVTIEQVKDGERTGEWLFSRQTLNSVKEYYRLTRGLPLQPHASIEDGYRIAIAAPGWMIPTHWIINLPQWAQRVYYDQTVWQWFLLFVTFVVVGLLAWVALRWSRGTAHAGPLQRPSTQRALVGPLSLMLLSTIASHAIAYQINVSGIVLAVLQFLLDAVFYLAAAWAVVLIGRLVRQAILGSTVIRPGSLDAQILSVSVIVADVLAISIIAILWAQSMGIPILAMVTGLGVGGIAVALAAQRSIENFFGSLMLFADRPVHIGDFCKFGDKM